MIVSSRSESCEGGMVSFRSNIKRSNHHDRSVKSASYFSEPSPRRNWTASFRAFLCFNFLIVNWCFGGTGCALCGYTCITAVAAEHSKARGRTREGGRATTGPPLSPSPPPPPRPSMQCERGDGWGTWANFGRIGISDKQCDTACHQIGNLLTFTLCHNASLEHPVVRVECASKEAD